MSDSGRVVHLRPGSVPDYLPQEPRAPEAVAILAGDAAVAVQRIEAGETAWQQDVTEQLRRLTTSYRLVVDELEQVKRGLVWPRRSVLAAIAFGVAIATFLAFLTAQLLTRN